MVPRSLLCAPLVILMTTWLAGDLPFGADSNQAHKKAPDWIRVTSDAGWKPRDSQGEFVYRNQLWILGGWFTPQTPNPRDVWKSPDGKRWTRVVETAPWEKSDLPAALVFRDKMWMMGGRSLPGTQCSNRVWSSTDGATWELVTDDAGWSPRLGPGFAVFQNKMWILGGTEDFYNGNDETLNNDVWSSADGRKWTRVLDKAPWSKRAYHQTVVFDGKIWVMGGGNRAPTTVSMNDVWCSEDGVRWTQVTDRASWGPRLWFSAVVYRNRMWVLGGWSEETKNLGDVWHSKDGENWSELKSDVTWKARHEHSAFVYQDKLWVAGGYADVLSNEVWNLEIPEAWFED